MPEIALYPIVNSKCGCGNENCRSSGKHPDPTGKGGGGRGIVTGNGLLVLDIDAKPGKPNGFESLRSKDLPETFTVKTPTGGAHLYYRYDPSIPVGNRVSFLPGCDIRGDGGFVVGPGSPHANGGTYEVIDDQDMTEAPVWLVEEARKKVTTTEIPVPLTPADPEFEEYVRRAINDLHAFPPAIEGDGGDLQLFLAAQIPVRKYRLPADISIALLEDYNLRCLPPWNDGGKTIARKVQEAALKGTKSIGTGDWLTAIINDVTSKHQYTFSPGDQRSIPWSTPININNLVHLLHESPQWKGVWRYNEFSRRSLAINPPMPLDSETLGLTETDVTMVQCWLQCHGLIVKRGNDELTLENATDWPTVWGKSVEDEHDQMIKAVQAGKEAVSRSIDTACRKNTFHPVKQYLESVRGKGTGVLDQVASMALGCPSEPAAVFVAKTLIGAVRRILNPGCVMETVLTLYGGQGVGKTTFVRQLFGIEFTRSQMPDLSSKDASAALTGFWAIELAELDRVLRAETSTLKEFFSRTHDDYRPAYGKTEIHAPRQSVFIGTTNVQDFLRDPTGARRYWPVEVGTMDLAWLRENRDAIWAEALELCEAGVQHHLTPEECDALLASQEDFVAEDDWMPIVLDYCAGRKHFKEITDIYTGRLKGEIKNLTKRESGRIRDCLKKLGCRYMAIRVKTGVIKAWKVPDHVQALAPSASELTSRALENVFDALTLN